MIGTASAAKLAAIRSLGVDHPIDYRRDDVGAEIQRLTVQSWRDVILDPIGGRSFAVVTACSRRWPAGLYGVSSIAPGERRSLWRVARTLFALPTFTTASLMNHNRAVLGLNLGHLWARLVSCTRRWTCCCRNWPPAASGR